jgi:anti-sigma B factor antagonist
MGPPRCRAGSEGLTVQAAINFAQIGAQIKSIVKASIHSVTTDRLRSRREITPEELPAWPPPAQTCRFPFCLGTTFDFCCGDGQNKDGLDSQADIYFDSGVQVMAELCQFSVALRVDPGTEGRVVVTVGGEVDLGSAPLLDAVLLDVCAAGHRDVTIDLARVTFIDVLGVEVIAEAAAAISAAGGKISVRALSRPARRVLDLLGARIEILNEREGQPSIGSCVGRHSKKAPPYRSRPSWQGPA